MSQPSINNIAEICSRHGIRKAVISPGSRNAPLTLAFGRHPDFECFSVSDERSAAFIAMGMAQSDKNPVALICTSGSAALNYAPAIAEAYFQQIPLLVLTADRPAEWIDQWDGQTIRQEDIYGRHVKKSYQFPLDTSHPDSEWHGVRMMNEAVNQCNQLPAGPVHVNISFREPFYPSKSDKWAYDKNVKIIKQTKTTSVFDKNHAGELQKAFGGFSKIAILLGQADYSPEFLEALNVISQKLNIPVFADIISNGNILTNSIHLPDSVCMPLLKQTNEDFVPELVVSFGKSIISKNLKLFLRKNLKNQWHISQGNEFISDPFQSLTQLIDVEPSAFLELLQQSAPKPNDFLNNWKSKDDEMAKKTTTFLLGQTNFNEFTVLKKAVNFLTQDYQLHLANSMSVRYANFIGLDKNKAIKVCCNRGTSGIDGSNSTAIGHAIANSGKKHLLITGDVAFFYDRNAFWHNYDYKNLKIILLNNAGGGIFRMISGPAEQPELEEFFVTKQRLNAKALSTEFGISYFSANNFNQLDEILTVFYQNKEAAILEIFTDGKTNQQIFELFKKHITT